MPSVNGSTTTGKQYWRSLDEFADTPEFREFMHREFPAGATEMLDSAERRDFLKIMGASLALAGLGLSGCRRWPKENIAPYARRPEDRIPGVPEHYATTMEIGGVGAGLLVTSYDGRPIKIEGNPEHPINAGATDVYAQASVLDMYDPDRSRHVRHDGAQSDFVGFMAWAEPHFAGLRNGRGNGLAILSEATSSPSVADMKRRLLQAYPNAVWHEYEPLNNDNAVEGSRIAFGSPHRTHYHFDRAKVIVSLDADFLGNHPAMVKHTRDFAAGRRADDAGRTMNRLYAFESTFSLTGANADHRVAVRSADVQAVAQTIASRTSSQISAPGDAAGVDAQIIEAIADDLRSHRGESLIIAGPRQPAAVHALAHLLNEELGNNGTTVTYSADTEAIAHEASLKALCDAIAANSVSTVVILGGNPAYNAPADLNFESLLGGVYSIHLSHYFDETSKACTWHVPRSHYLEAWGDARASDGTIGITQPLIEPLYPDSRSSIELLAAISNDDLKQGYDIVRRTRGAVAGDPDFERPWRRDLHEGFIPDSSYQPASPPVQASAVAAIAQPSNSGDSSGYEIVYTQDNCVYDGRFANNGWLQELPDPLTKLTWDNAALIGMAAARDLSVKDGDMIRITTGGRSVDCPVVIMPGHHDGSVSLALGYGRSEIGRIAEGAGVNAYDLRASGAMSFATGATVEKIGGSYKLARTQDHHAPDTTGGKGTQERLPTLLREATLAEYRENPDFAAHRTHVVHRLNIWSADLMEGAEYAWAMSIDLSACTGCSACVVACQAENNIPIVGKDQVLRARELHWLRIDRYFKFKAAETDEDGHATAWDPNTVEAVGLQPVNCMHCENAPCEQVCPVAATTHDDDGLNVMVYNRCIGTRYCSNNCPYKVRRFNYFDYQAREPVREGGFMAVKPSYYTTPQSHVEPLKQMQHNPEVTIRSRGVMEKCTYCIQRISAEKIKAKNEWVKTKPEDRPERVTVNDQELTTACAQACPAHAIEFGDMNDPNSRVHDLHNNHPRSYRMLEEILTKPRTRYLAKLRNPSPRLDTSTPSGGHNGDTHDEGSQSG